MKRLWKVSMLPALALAGLFAAQAAAAETVTIATEGAYPPFNTTNADGSLGGFEIELGNALCAKASLDCKWVKQDFSGMIPALTARKYDMIFSAMSINPEREQAGLFSLPYITDNFRLYGKKGTEVDVPDGLKGKTVGVFTGSTGERFIEEKWGGVAETRGYGDIDQVNADLDAGRIDYGFNAQLPVEQFLKSDAGADYAFFGPVFNDALLGKGMGAMFRKDGTALKAKFDEAIRAAYDDGTFDALSKTYFGDEVDVSAKGLW